MAKTVRKESNRSKKGESDAHKMRRSYKEELEILKDLDEDELEEYEYTPPPRHVSQKPFDKR